MTQNRFNKCSLVIKFEQVENVNIKHYIKHSSPWQWFGYYFNSANILANFIWRRLSMLKYEKTLQIALSLQNISIKYINIKINVYFWQPGFKKGDNWNANQTPRLSFLDRQSSDQNFSSRGIMIGNHRNKTTES